MPTDGFSFREIEGKGGDFKDEPHNVRLSLATDRVNPFKEIRSVFVINKNIPPWMSIKREHIMLTMILPGMQRYH